MKSDNSAFGKACLSQQPVEFTSAAEPSQPYYTMRNYPSAKPLQWGENYRERAFYDL